MRHLILPSLALLLLAGCSGKDYRTATVSEFKDNHPYAKPLYEMPMTDGTMRRFYIDLVPRISASGAYTTEQHNYAITSRDDTVLEFAHGTQIP